MKGWHRNGRSPNYSQLTTQVGRAVVPLRPDYTIIEALNAGGRHIALIERVRIENGRAAKAYAIVLAGKAIVCNGSALRRLAVLPYRRGKAQITRMASPQAWFSDFVVASAKFHEGSSRLAELPVDLFVKKRACAARDWGRWSPKRR